MTSILLDLQKGSTLCWKEGVGKNAERKPMCKALMMQDWSQFNNIYV